MRAVRAFTLVECLFALVMTTIVVLSAAVAVQAHAIRIFRERSINAEEITHQQTAREITDVIKRAHSVSVHADSAAAQAGERAVRGLVLVANGTDDAGNPTVTVFEWVPPDPAADESDEATVRRTFRCGQLIRRDGGPTREARILLEFASLQDVSAEVVFDLDLGVPRARWRQELTRVSGTVGPLMRMDWQVISNPLRMR